MILFRISYTIILILGIIAVPWYIEIVMVIAALFFFKQYYEALFVAILFSIVSGIPILLPIILFGIFLIVIEYIKTGLMAYSL